MIWLTRLDGEQFMLNDDRILYVELRGDTMITMQGGERIRVLESAEELAERVQRWRRRTSGLDLLLEDEGSAQERS